MSEERYIQDAKGKRVPLTDRFGNLGREALILYAEDGLSTSDRAVVNALAEGDEFMRDALDAYPQMKGSPRSLINGLNEAIAEKSGATLLVSESTNRLPLLRIAAGIALLIGVAVATYFTSQWISSDQMAMNEEPISEVATPLPVAKETEPVLIIDPVASIDTSGSMVMDATMTASEEPLPQKVLEKPTVEAKAKEAPKPKPVENNQEKKQETPAPAKEVAKTAATTVTDSDADTESTPLLIADGMAKREQSLAQETEEQSKVDGKKSRKAAKKEEEVAEPASASRAAARREALQADMQEIPQDGPIQYDQIQTPPRFPGGDLEMLRFISRNKNYPEALKREGVTGSVQVTFTVEENGKVSDVQVSKGIHEVLDQDASRVIRAMPKWSPGQQDGKTVKTTRTVVIKYD